MSEPQTQSATTTTTKKPEPTNIFGTTTVPLPRVAIKFCVQCKWNLRAAYYAQELLSTFSLALGEVSLIPSTSGTFVITLLHATSSSSSAGDNAAPDPTTFTPSNATGLPQVEPVKVQETVLWDYKIQRGFPETKILKQMVRDIVEPGRNLGHVDRKHQKQPDSETSTVAAAGEINAATTAAASEPVQTDLNAEKAPLLTAIDLSTKLSSRITEESKMGSDGIPPPPPGTPAITERQQAGAVPKNVDECEDCA